MLSAASFILFRAARALPLIVAAALASVAGARAGSVDIVTHHVDPQRTGWNRAEKSLTWANVNAAKFGKLVSVALDEQVDAQPLIVSAATIAAAGAAGYPNDVVIVATENNTIYEIDSVTGAVLLKKSFGTPVAMTSLPGRCNNNSAVVGINSTPVLDLTNFTMYVVTYTWENNAPVHRLRKLWLKDLTEAAPSVVISGSQTLADGSQALFQSASQRQRAALLMSSGKVYAAFGSFCDFNTNASRGWLMAFDAATMNQVAAGLTDWQTAAQAGPGIFSGWSQVYFLSTIWMSGYGPSADSAGNVYATTGNSDASNANNFPNSALKANAGLTALVDYFTPSNYRTLDLTDEDFGSGGIMVVPDQPNGLRFAAAAGKDGRMFLFNRDSMGGYVANGPDKPTNVNIGACWCGPGYFVGSDGKPRILSSGGTQAQTWFLPATATGGLTREAISPSLQAGQDGGFHTFISSNAQTAGTAIAWAVSRPVNGTVSLYAFKADGGLGQLFSAPAGVWTSSSNNANIFPVVAGGRAYVASYKVLNIFGLIGASPAPAATTALAVPQTSTTTTAAAPAPVGGKRYWGTVASVTADGKTATIKLRTAKTLKVDLTGAMSRNSSARFFTGANLEVEGSLSSQGVLLAQVARRAKRQADWGPDVP